MGEFAASLAHEVRNPLTAVKIDLQSLQEKLAGDEALNAPLHRALEEIDRLDRILSSYLALGSDADVEPERLDLADVIQRTIKLMAADLEEMSFEDGRVGPGRYVHIERIVESPSNDCGPQGGVCRDP